MRFFSCSQKNFMIEWLCVLLKKKEQEMKKKSEQHNQVMKEVEKMKNSSFLIKTVL